MGGYGWARKRRTPNSESALDSNLEAIVHIFLMTYWLPFQAARIRLPVKELDFTLLTRRPATIFSSYVRKRRLGLR